MDLEQRIHSLSQRLIPAAQNGGYPPMIVYYHRHAPVLLDHYAQPVIPFQPDPRMLEAAKMLGALSDFIIIPSNGVHMFQQEIERASGKSVLSMVDLVVEEVKKKQWRKVGVLGFKTAMVYANKLKAIGIQYETIDATLQLKMDKSIERVMEGRDDHGDRMVMREVVAALRSKNVDGIIPGCTELPFLLREEINSKGMVNPIALLADAAVRVSIDGE